MDLDTLQQQAAELFRPSSPDWSVSAYINEFGKLSVKAEHPLSCGVVWEGLAFDEALEVIERSSMFRHETANIAAAPEIVHEDVVMSLRVGAELIPTEAIRWVTAILYDHDLLTDAERDWVRCLQPLL